MFGRLLAATISRCGPPVGGHRFMAWRVQKSHLGSKPFAADSSSIAEVAGGASKATLGEARMKMTSARMRTITRLKESQNNTVSLTTFNEIDMSRLLALRPAGAGHHTHAPWYMGAFARACALAIRTIPEAGASIDGDEVVYRDYVDLRVVLMTPSAPMDCPVVRNVQRMGVGDAERAIEGAAERVCNGELGAEEMIGGTFTISDGSALGSRYGTSIITTPQTAALSMHAISDRATVVDGRIVPRPMMTVALTYDHRLMDGREGTTFLIKVKELIEDPCKMLLG